MKSEYIFSSKSGSDLRAQFRFSVYSNFTLFTSNVILLSLKFCSSSLIFSTSISSSFTISKLNLDDGDVDDGDVNGGDVDGGDVDVGDVDDADVDDDPPSSFIGTSKMCNFRFYLFAFFF